MDFAHAVWGNVVGVVDKGETVFTEYEYFGRLDIIAKTISQFFQLLPCRDILLQGKVFPYQFCDNSLFCLFDYVVYVK